MNKWFSVILILTLSGCATHEWRHSSGDNSNAEFMESQCRNFVTINYPTYICRNFTYCQPDETGILLSSIIRNNAAFTQCMNQNGYRKYQIQ